MKRATRIVLALNVLAIAGIVAQRFLADAVVTPEGRFGPAQVDEMTRIVAALGNGGGKT